MTTITASPAALVDNAPATASRRPVGRAGSLAAVSAAVATTAVAAAARAAGIELAIDGERIPLLGFAQLTLIFSFIGLGLAVALRRWARRPRRTFVTTTVALTALSLVPDLLISASAGSKPVLMATHVVAAAIVIPVIAARLAESRD
jgi:hypothetical protein